MLATLRTHVNRLRDLVADYRWCGDRRTWRQYRRPTLGEHQLTVRFRGRRVPLHVRGSTMDLQLARQILRDDSEYRLPVDLQPRVIIDAGANIGMTSLYFGLRYPQARIYAFEPLPQNVELLRRNTAILGDRVTIIPQGLGAEEGSFAYRLSDDPANFGGGTFHGVGCDTSRTLELRVTTLARVCAEQQIEQIDVLKVDTEGAEWSVLRGVPRPLLRSTRVIIGELHGIKDLRVLHVMSRTHQIGVSKRFNRSCYPFVAVRHDLAV